MGRVPALVPVVAERLVPCAEQTPVSPPPRKMPLFSFVFRGCVAGLCLALTGEVAQVFLARNFHEIVPGRVYRCAQPSGAALKDMLARYQIRTVLNLRGCCDPSPWYLDECRATRDQDVCQEDICLSAGRMPAVGEMRHLVEVVDHVEYPILLHCWRGADRTGLVSAMILLLSDDVDFATARRQLGLRYGHLAIGRPAYLDRFLDSYSDWLVRRNEPHTPARFRHWINAEYCPAACRCEITALDVPDQVKCNAPVAMRFRFRNTSEQSWNFHAGTNAGVHAVFDLKDTKGNSVASGRAGLYEAEVAPGESIDLTLALPAIHQPGRYQLMVDLNDEAQCWFFQVGSEPWERELEVR
jgi:Tyrosine phosphatase family